jgi:hypothetical protein
MVAVFYESNTELTVLFFGPHVPVPPPGHIPPGVRAVLPAGQHAVATAHIPNH